MLRLSLAKSTAAVGGMGLALIAAAGIVSADPLDSVINTTCNYNQVIAALNATDPGAAAQFNTSPAAQGWLRNFLESSPPQRVQLANQIQALPGAQAYVGLVQQVASTCRNY